MQPSSRAPTPSSSNRRAARPNASPSGPPQCRPCGPHSPSRQRRNDNQTGEVEGQQRLDGRLQRRAEHGQPLDEQEVGRLVGQRAGEQADGLRGVRAVDVGVDGEGDGHVVVAGVLRDRRPRIAHAAPRQLDPVRGTAVELGTCRGEQAAGVRPDDVAARLHVAPVRCGRPVEDHAALRSERVGETVVGRARRRRSPDGRGGHAPMTAARPHADNRVRTLRFRAPRVVP
jgi:hypothetical protein